MSQFMGGSAPAMARQIAEGYTLVTAVTLKRMSNPQLDQLLFELDRLVRELRGEHTDLEDLPAIQLKNRKISRIVNTQRVIQGTKQQRGRRGQ